MRTVTEFTRILAVVAAVGLLASAAQAGFNWSDQTTRWINIESEGVTNKSCTNDAVSLPATCQEYPSGVACGDTSVSPNGCPCHPNNRFPDASCFDFANTATADWSDSQNNFWGTATYIGGVGGPNCPTCDWNIRVEPFAWARSLQQTLGNSGATVTTIIKTMDFDIDTAASGPASVQPRDSGNEYYRNDLLFGGVLPYQMHSVGVDNDAPWFGQADNPLQADPEDGIHLVFSCATSPAPVPVGPSYPSPGVPYLYAESIGGTGLTTLTVAASPVGCVAGIDCFDDLPEQPISARKVVLIGNSLLGGVGPHTGDVTDIAQPVGQLNLDIANPLNLAAGLNADTFTIWDGGSSFGPNRPIGNQLPVCASLTTAPGYGNPALVAGETVLTEITSVTIEQTVGGTPTGQLAIAKNWGTMDHRYNELSVDIDSDGVPDIYDTCVPPTPLPANITRWQNGPLAGNCNQNEDYDYDYSLPIPALGPPRENDGTGVSCDADWADDDGIVGGTDFLKFSAAFGSTPGAANWNVAIDSDCDGAIGGTDFLLFSAQFGGSIGPSGYACAGSTIPCP